MKVVQTVTFEDGDAVASTEYPWLAIRRSGIWVHTDSNAYDDVLQDDLVRTRLGRGVYKYIGQWDEGVFEAKEVDIDF